MSNYCLSNYTTRSLSIIPKLPSIINSQDLISRCSSILPNSFRFLKIHSLPCFWSSYYYVLCFSSNVPILVLGLWSFVPSNSKDTTHVCSNACNLFSQFSSNDKNVFLQFSTTPVCVSSCFWVLKIVFLKFLSCLVSDLILFCLILLMSFSMNPSIFTVHRSNIGALIPIERKGYTFFSICLMFPILCETTRPLPLLPCTYLYTSQPKYFQLVIQIKNISN